MTLNKKERLKIAMIILAAGESKRMGTIKQLLPWKNSTVLDQVIKTGIACNVDKVFVVLGANHKSIIKETKNKHIEIIYNQNWASGMGSSISCAMKYLGNYSENFDAVLIALADQPLIDVTYYNNLIFNFINTKSNIVASKHNNRVGVPAIFSSKYFHLLSKLELDYGARIIIKENKEDLKVIDEGGKLNDLDTISDYNEIFQSYGKN